MLGVEPVSTGNDGDSFYPLPAVTAQKQPPADTTGG
jgi:hypothetical protein